MQRILLYIYCLLIATPVLAQDATVPYYRSPLPADMSILLASNFGELRGNHFHAGLDFRVGGVPGAKLYAVANGYVSRISVQPDGYGKAVYINHPNGTTSVYGHLQAFSNKIKTYIEDLQYNRQRSAINITLDSNTIRVRKGEVIGTAGNSGNSFGAHLHFELRKTATQMPFNTLSSNIHKVTDNIPPVIKQVVFYKYEEADDIPVVESFLTTTAGRQKTVDAPNRFFIAVDATDRQNGTSGKFDINRMEVKLDDKLIFSYRMDEFSFEESRYVNSLIAYDYLQISSHPLIKTYVEPGNKLSTAYETVEENGIITLRDNEKHQLEITVYDDHNNHSGCKFTVQQQSAPPVPAAYEEDKPGVPMYYDQANRYDPNGMSLLVPAGSLYRSIFLTVDTAMYTPVHAVSPLWNIHNNDVPLHSTGASLHLWADLPKYLHDKALIVSVTKTDGIKAVGGSWERDGVTAKITAFGNYCVMVDTIAPVIQPLFKRGADLRRHSTLSIKISDNLSDIATYKAYIDGEWALMEYDEKKNELVYTFNSKRIKRNTRHTLLLTVTDKYMNTAGLETIFAW